ncbi:hypothetical protein Vadar_000394 [Vaccinium darrowii]|uniref:Uncharacterized protein n=1 Tax=Vaccinium darrowii TaxID=229202 RepID=A0ACB7XXC4_9ERIC|nr:hypothetical protein Vadar_000394 [Vaccinium darrowii]
MSNLGFGFDPYTNDYKLVRFGITSASIPIGDVAEIVEMYDLSTDSWREVAVESPIESGFHCLYDSYASWNGNFFWYAYHSGGGSVMMAFSMSDEVFEQMPVPEVCLLDHNSENKLFVLNNSLAMVFYPKWWSNPFDFPPEEFMLEKSFDIWVMNVEDVEVSWTKKFSIGHLHGLYWALGFRRNGEFLLESGHRQLMSYNLYTQERKEYQVCDHYQDHPPPPNLQVLLYTESLVSVKRLA